MILARSQTPVWERACPQNSGFACPGDIRQTEFALQVRFPNRSLETRTGLFLSAHEVCVGIYYKCHLFSQNILRVLRVLRGYNKTMLIPYHAFMKKNVASALVICYKRICITDFQRNILALSSVGIAFSSFCHESAGSPKNDTSETDKYP